MRGVSCTCVNSINEYCSEKYEDTGAKPQNYYFVGIYMLCGPISLKMGRMGGRLTREGCIFSYD